MSNDGPQVKPAPASAKQREIMLCEAQEILSHASRHAEFIQSITLVEGGNGSLTLQPRQVTGLYYCFEDLIGRIEKAEKLLEEGRRHD